MRKLSILIFLTLDGVMQAPLQPEENTPGSFKHGGWAAKYYEEVMAQVNEEALAQPFDLLFGRKTYVPFAAHFSNVDNEEARKFNTATKYVATSTLSIFEWKNTIPITGDVAGEISRLKEQDGPLLQVHGSAHLIQTLLAHDLIDEFRLWTFPVVVGGGTRLFGEGSVRTDMTLVKTKSTSNGVVMSIYRRAGTSAG